MGSGHVHPAPLKTSCLGRLDARAKILAFLPAILAVNLVPQGHLVAVGAVAAVFAFLMAMCGRDAFGVLRRAIWFAPFVLFVVVTLPFAAAGSEAFGVNLGFGRLVATDEGLRQAGAVAMKAGTSILGVLLLSGTTEAPDLFKGLRALGLPKAFVAILSMVYRYLFEIGDELSRLRRAAAARGFQMRDLRAVPRMGTMVAALFVRSVVRSEKIHHAMAARGYDGEVRVLGHTHFGKREAAFMAIFYVVTSSLAALAIYA